MVTSDANWKLPLKWNKAAGELPSHIVKPGSVPVDYMAVPRPRVFCASLSDVFEDWDGPITNSSGLSIGECIACRRWQSIDDQSCWKCGNDCVSIFMDDVRRRLFELIDATPNLDWLLLTKRPENIRRMWPEWAWSACATGDCPHDSKDQCESDPFRWHRPNVWLGCSVENQEQADKRIPELLKCRNMSPVLFLSCEPLLGQVDLSFYL